MSKHKLQELYMVKLAWVAAFVLGTVFGIGLSKLARCSKNLTADTCDCENLEPDGGNE